MERYDRLDALRGAWMLWMAAFHFGFDLAWFRMTHANFYADPFWTTQRVAILSGFLLWAGLAQGVALQAGQSATAFWRRWTQVAAGAALVSAGSALAFPNSWIGFGVLHAFAVLLPLLRFGAARLRGGALLALAAAAVALPAVFRHPVFDSPWLSGVGLVTRKPITEDYVPLLPWVAPLLVGLWVSRQPVALAWLKGPAPLRLARLGRWPLSFYLLHQPVLVGGLWLWQRTMAA